MHKHKLHVSTLQENIAPYSAGSGQLFSTANIESTTKCIVNMWDVVAETSPNHQGLEVLCGHETGIISVLFLSCMMKAEMNHGTLRSTSTANTLVLCGFSCLLNTPFECTESTGSEYSEP